MLTTWAPEVKCKALFSLVSLGMFLFIVAMCYTVSGILTTVDFHKANVNKIQRQRTAQTPVVPPRPTEKVGQTHFQFRNISCKFV